MSNKCGCRCWWVCGCMWVLAQWTKNRRQISQFKPTLPPLFKCVSAFVNHRRKKTKYIAAEKKDRNNKVSLILLLLRWNIINWIIWFFNIFYFKMHKCKIKVEQLVCNLQCWCRCNTMQGAVWKFRSNGPPVFGANWPPLFGQTNPLFWYQNYYFL